MNEQFTMPRKLAHELLGALFNGPGLNPAGYEAIKQDFAALMRASPAAEAREGLTAEQLSELRARPSAEVLMATARRLIAELNDEPDDVDEDCRNCQARGIGHLHAELLRHMDSQRTTTTPPTTGA